MVELRDLHAVLSIEQSRPLFPFSREWLERALGISKPNQLLLLQADQDLPPEIRENDLVLVDRSGEKKLPSGEGLQVFSVPVGLAVRPVQVELRKGVRG